MISAVEGMWISLTRESAEVSKYLNNGIDDSAQHAMHDRNRLLGNA